MRASGRGPDRDGGGGDRPAREPEGGVDRDGGPERKPRRREQLVFLALMGLVFAWVAWEARTFPDRARIFPQVAAVGAVLLTLFALVREWWAGDAWEGYDGVPFLVLAREGVPFLLWIGGYYVALWLVGFMAGTAFFVAGFLRLQDGMGWLGAAVRTAALLAVVAGLQWALDLRLPEGLLAEALTTIGR